MVVVGGGGVAAPHLAQWTYARVHVHYTWEFHGTPSTFKIIGRKSRLSGRSGGMLKHEKSRHISCLNGRFGTSDY